MFVSQYMQQITVECTTNLSTVQYMANLLLPQHITVHTAHHYTHNSTCYLSLYTQQCAHYASLYVATYTDTTCNTKLCKYLSTIVESFMSTSPGIVVAVSLSSCPKESPLTLLCVRQVDSSSYVQIKKDYTQIPVSTHGHIGTYQGYFITMLPVHTSDSK